MHYTLCNHLVNGLKDRYSKERESLMESREKRQLLNLQSSPKLNKLEGCGIPFIFKGKKWGLQDIRYPPVQLWWPGTTQQGGLRQFYYNGFIAAAVREL